MEPEDFMKQQLAPVLSEYESILVIMLYRVYDAQMAFLATVNPTKAEQMHEMHARGEYLCPPPAISASAEPS